MLPSSEMGLRTRLEKLFLGRSEAVVLRDDLGSITGVECREVCASVEALLARAELAERGVVGIVLEHGACQAMALLAVLFSERIPILLSGQMGAEKRLEIMRRAGVQCLLASTAPVEGGPWKLVGTCRLRGDVVFGMWRRAGDEWDAPQIDTGAALLMHTSGSTGGPKVVRHSAQSLVFMAERISRLHRIDSDTIAAIVLPIHFSMALATQFLPTLLMGGESVFVSGVAKHGDVFRRIVESRATNVALVPDMLHLLSREVGRRGLAPAACVKSVQFSGDFFFENHLACARTLFPNAVLHKGYGCTETFRISSIASRDAGFDRESVGRVLEGLEVVIRREDGSRAVPGEVGMILVRGSSLMTGYAGQDSGLDRAGFWNSGDYGRFTEDGLLCLEGRGDGLFKSMGAKVSCKEIEEAASSCPGMGRSLCMPLKDRHDILKPVLFVELPPGTRDDDFLTSQGKSFLEHLKARLPAYAVPKEIVLLEELPRLFNGKANRDALLNAWISLDRDSDRRALLQGSVFFVVGARKVLDTGGRPVPGQERASEADLPEGRRRRS